MSQNYSRIDDSGIFFGQPQIDKFKSKQTYQSNTIFRISRDELGMFFEKNFMKVPKNYGETTTSLKLLEECGYVDGMLQLLVTDKETGIIGDLKDLTRRNNLFGRNNIKLPSITSFGDLLASQFEDSAVITLWWATTVYLLFSFFGDDTLLILMEALTIYSGLFLASVIAAICDYVKERQFLVIKDEINNQKVIVYRGQYGQNQYLSREIVVGDIIDIQEGDIVPADMILVDGLNIHVDESKYNPGDEEFRDVKKSLSVVTQEMGENEKMIFTNNHKENPDPFLLTGSYVIRGQGKGLVCAVGKYTRIGKQTSQEDLVMKEQKTHLETKLEIMSEQITKYALMFTALIVVSKMVFMSILIFIDEEQDFLSNETLLDFMQTVIVGVTIMIVAIPEGLPLAVSIAMALSINNLKKEEILIKNLEGVQNCAMLHDVCVGKTGTITENDMFVSNFHVGQAEQFENFDRNTVPNHFNENYEVNTDLKQLIKQAIIGNSDVRIEAKDNYSDGTFRFEPQGSGIEVGLYNFLVDNGEDIMALNVQRNREAKSLYVGNFIQSENMMIVVRNIPDDEENVAVYIKGAPEKVINMCNSTYDNNFTPIDIDDDEKQRIQETIVSEGMAQQGQKVISFAFKTIDKSFWDETLRDHGMDSTELREEILSNLIYLATFGLDNHVRTGVKEAIQMIKYGQQFEEGEEPDASQISKIQVRMLSSDHHQTAVSVAKQVGIVSEDNFKEEGVCMTGEEFRANIGGYEIVIDDSNKKEKVKKVVFDNIDMFKDVKQSLRVISRCTPEDKLIWVSGIKQSKGFVSMTGDSVSDIDALRTANVGICMGEGSEVAKQYSDIVLLDNDFVSIHRSINWGKTLFDNVKKFVQFQLTINLSVCLLVLISCVTLGRSPFNVVQLLWTNLIMDILAAIALGTEPKSKQVDYVPGEEFKGRIGKKDKIVETYMWKYILGQCGYQLLVLLTFSYFGVYIFFEEDERFNILFEKLLDDKLNPTNRLVLDTIIFHSFILMNLANMFCCKVGGEKDKKKLVKIIFSNITFYVVIAAEIFLQYKMINIPNGEFLKHLIGTSELEDNQIYTCYFVAFLVLPVNVILTYAVPTEKFNFMKTVDIETKKGRNALTDIFDQAENRMSVARKSIRKSINGDLDDFKKLQEEEEDI